MSALLSLDDAKAQLNYSPGPSADDSELGVYVAAAIEVVEAHIGPVDPRPCTAVVTGPVPVLPVTPVLSLTTITDPTGVPLDLSGFTVSPGGVLRGATWWARGARYVVGYVAGRAAVPAAANLAARVIVQHLWTTQRGATRRGTRVGADEAPTGLGYALPNRAVELLAPHRLPPAVA